jgi:hypothetical protein
MDLFGRFKRCAIIIFSLFAVGIAAGCGGGGGAGFVSSQNLHSFDPNYVPDLKSLTHWASFPVKVYFVPSTESTPERQGLAVSGMSQWNHGTDGLVRFEVTQDPAAAQISIQFVPSLEGTLIGWTNWTFDGAGVIQQASTKISVKGLDNGDVQWVAAHEFGHAMGLDGHSKEHDDVMFAVHLLGSDWNLTTRDENTVKTAYESLLNRSAEPGRAVVWGPLNSAEVKCYRP